jgi:hypothetical protein
MLDRVVVALLAVAAAAAGGARAACDRRPPAGQRMNSAGLSLVKHFEGWYPACYLE